MPAKPAVPVVVALSVAKDVPIQIDVIGRVEPYSTVSVKPQIDGQLMTVHFKEGDIVHKDDLLFSIDPRPVEAELRGAEANRLKNVTEAENAAGEARRMAKLLTQGFVSQDEHDQAQTRAAALRAAVKADEAAVETAKLQLAYCQIRSPITGRIGAILVHEGNVLKARETPLAVINQMQPTYVSFAALERDLPEIRSRAQTIPLRVNAQATQDGPVVEGRLSFVNNTVDTTTGTVTLKAEFANENEELWPGQFVNAVLTLGTLSNAVVIPTQAIQTGQQGQFVFVVGKDNTVEVRPVTTGKSLRNETVIPSGLAADETVVTSGQIRLAAGATVEVITTPPAIPAETASK